MESSEFKPIAGDGDVWGIPLVMAGPCSAESESQVLSTAEQLAAFGVKVYRAGIWKPRTKPGGFEGVGERGLAWLAKVRDKTGMKTATEVAKAVHVHQALDSGIDILWIGARTTANPFAVQEIADALEEERRDVTVLVKNPVNPDLDLWIGALERIYNAGIRRLGAVHRGFSCYEPGVYRNPPQWHIPLDLRRLMPGMPIIVDPSHMGGSRDLVRPICQEALDMKFEGFMIESHCNPGSALSDSQQQVTPAELKQILESLVVRNSSLSAETLEEMRRQIDRIDMELMELYARRMSVAREIGRFKREHSMPVVQETRYGKLMKRNLETAEKLGMDPEFARTVMQAVHAESVRQQIKIMNT